MKISKSFFRFIPIQLIFLTSCIVANAQAFLQTPIEGTMRKDFVIVNYVDWSADTSNPILDHSCGSKTYDGHQGTDYVLKSFSAMDSGVYIIAAADGVVTFTQDGIFDREMSSDVSKGLGNYICIKHPNLYYTYYGHLKKNSLLVQNGDTIKAGDRIAEVGSSGNSTDPHLHFELWYDSLYVVDPYSGSCGNPGSLWLDGLPYDTNLLVWDSGLDTGTIDLTSLRERKVNMPDVFDPDVENQLNYYALIHGVQAGDSLRIDWYAPNEANAFTYTFYINQDWWYYYFWSFIDSALVNAQNDKIGTWKVSLSNNNQVISEESFVVGRSAILPNAKYNHCGGFDLNVLENLSINQFRLTNSLGQEILDRNHKSNFKLTYEALPPGMYYLQTQVGLDRCSYHFYKLR